MTALEGLRVLDVATGGAGSLAAGLLTDFGAEVVKVIAEDPRVSRPDHLPDWMVWNRGKRLALFVDSSGADRPKLQALAATCDLIVADTGSDLARLGLGIPEVDSGQIVLLTPPYGEHGAPWFGGAESPELLNFISAIASYQASYSGDPIDGVYPFLRYVQAVWAAACAVACLTERERSGLGQTVTVGGLHAAGVFGGFVYTRPLGEEDPGRDVGPGGLNPMYTRYQAADGQWVYVGGLGPKFGEQVVRQTNSLHLLDDPRIDGHLERLWQPDNSRWVMDHFAKLFATRPAAYWIKVLEASDVPCTLVSDRDTWFESEQVALLGQRVEAEDPVLGRVQVVGPPVSAATGSARVEEAASLHPLSEIEWTADGLAPQRGGNHRPSGEGPLAGYRVASLGSYVAGPYGACLLAELGAEVLKVEPLTGDPWRMQGFPYNRGVKSLAIDLREPAGRDALQTVLAGCDVVLDNFRVGVMDRLGIGHDALARLNPKIVTVAVTAYGEEGPLAAKPGYDAVIQAASGMIRAQGGDEEPVVFSIPPTDHTVAAIAAFATVVGLLNSERQGTSQHMSTSLAATANLLQSADLVRYPGRPAPKKGGRDFPGPAPTDRVYRTENGFVRLQTAELDVQAWQHAGLAIDPARLQADPASEIGRVLASLPNDQALAALFAAEVPAVPARRITEIMTDPELRDEAHITTLTTPRGVTYAAVGRLAFFSRTPQHARFITPGLGEHSVEILAGAGLDQQHIQELVASEVVLVGGPQDLVFLPPYR